MYLCSLKAASDAASFGLNIHIIRDAGRTQTAPGSGKTVLCIGPGSACVSLANYNPKLVLNLEIDFGYVTTASSLLLLCQCVQMNL